MNCLEAEVYLSAVYDGETVPSTAAQHIANCDACRGVLEDYSKMGTELRLAAALQPVELPALSLPSRPKTLQFLWAGISIPRFVLAALVACCVLAIVVASNVRAQTSPLWFEFNYGLTQNSESPYKVAQSRYDDTGYTVAFVNGSTSGAAVRVQVESISSDDVVLRVRAVPPKFEVKPNGFNLLADPGHKISLDGVSAIHYKPGESLSVPIEGGGTVYLKGEVLNHQPKIAFGEPLEPPIGELFIRSPVLLADDQLLGNSNGATSIASDENTAVNFCLGSNGTFVFALKPFPGAVKGEANWGEITFRLEDRRFLLLAAAPITGGEQPRPVWVRHDLISKYANPGPSLGVDAIPQSQP